MINNLGLKFISVAKKNALKPAILFKNKSVTFKQLDNLSNKLASWVIKSKIPQYSVVCLTSEKSLFNFAMIVALIKLGVTYTIIDQKSPIKRIKKILNIIRPSAVITNRSNERFFKNKKINIFFEEDIKRFSKKEINLDKYIQNVPSSTLSYLMFTSGSTGFPKGVSISHSNLIYFSEWCKNEFDISAKDRVTNLNPLFFDNSVFDIYGGLFNGASIVPVSRVDTVNPSNTVKILKKKRATTWFSVPSLITYYQKFFLMNKKNLPSIKKIIFGGEGFPKKNLKKLFVSFSKKVSLFNVYGPTECTCICSSYKISQKDFTTSEMQRYAPFGTNLARNFKYLILGNNNKLINKKGMVGELFIGGDLVGPGYYNQPRETLNKFIQCPLHSSYRDIYYKSGDLVYKDLKNNKIYFSSRKDNQIKFHGYRIELDEIENNLSLIKGIKECAVTFGKKNSTEQITAWVVSNLGVERILKSLSDSMPAYMLPKNIIKLKNLPKNSNGKIDRMSLKRKYYDR